MTVAAVRGLRNPFRSRLRVGVVVDTKGATPGQVTIKIQKGTVIKHGDGYLFLPGTKGRVVAITYVEDKGEKVAKSVEVKSAKP